MQAKWLKLDLACLYVYDVLFILQMHVLLQSWPPVDQDTALELLDCIYPDKNVRDFAVKCLKQSIR